MNSQLCMRVYVCLVSFYRGLICLSPAMYGLLGDTFATQVGSWPLPLLRINQPHPQTWSHTHTCIGHPLLRHIHLSLLLCFAVYLYVTFFVSPFPLLCNSLAPSVLLALFHFRFARSVVRPLLVQTHRRLHFELLCPKGFLRRKPTRCASSRTSKLSSSDMALALLFSAHGSTENTKKDGRYEVKEVCLERRGEKDRGRKRHVALRSTGRASAGQKSR